MFSKQIPHFNGSLRFIIPVNKKKSLSHIVNKMNLVQSCHPFSLRATSITFHIAIGIPQNLFPSGYTTRILPIILRSPMHLSCPAHLSHLNKIHLIITIDRHKLLSSSPCNSSSFFLHVLLGPNNLRLNLYCSSSSRDDRL